MTSKEEEVFFQVHSELPREGPGSRESTRKAFATIRNLPLNPKILDVGCGPGAETLHLAELSTGEIYALDNHKPYIEQLKETVKQKKLTERVFPLLGDMNKLPFEHCFFDLIWAEGCIYSMGLEQGLIQWRPFLKHYGFIAFTEVTWLRDDPPEELRLFWKRAYPAIGSIQKNKNIIRRTGYTLQHHFVLPESDWWEQYYGPIEKKLPLLKSAYVNDAESLAVLEIEEKEIDLYRRYSDYYGYVFYIA